MISSQLTKLSKQSLGRSVRVVFNGAKRKVAWTGRWSKVPAVWCPEIACTFGKAGRNDRNISFVCQVGDSSARKNLQGWIWKIDLFFSSFPSSPPIIGTLPTHPEGFQGAQANFAQRLCDLGRSPQIHLGSCDFGERISRISRCFFGAFFAMELGTHAKQREFAGVSFVLWFVQNAASAWKYQHRHFEVHGAYINTWQIVCYFCSSGSHQKKHQNSGLTQFEVYQIWTTQKMSQDLSRQVVFFALLRFKWRQVFKTFLTPLTPCSVRLWSLNLALPGRSPVRKRGESFPVLMGEVLHGAFRIAKNRSLRQVSEVEGEKKRH